MNARDSKDARRAQARAEREAQELAAHASQRRRRLLTVVAAIAAVVVLVIGAIALTGGDETPSPTQVAKGEVTGAAEVAAQFKGVPQKDMVIGNADAPVTLVEYFDMQCPFCAQFSTGALGELINQYVRDGQLRIVLRPIAFLDQQSNEKDSVQAASAVLAADAQGYGPQFAELFFHNQGPENSGYVTPDFVRGIAEGIKGLDPDPIAEAVEKPEPYGEQLAKNIDEFQTTGLAGTPGFALGLTDGDLQAFAPDSLDAASFAARIDKLLKEQ